MPDNNQPRIGLVGPGIMGLPMGMNLMKAGYALGVYGRRPESCTKLVEAGASAYPTPAALAAESDILITMVSDTPDVEQVLFGENGAYAGGQAGLLVIDMSTISPVATRNMATRLAEKGIRMLDAPVSGGETGAIEGTLTIMVGGKEADFNEAMPVFSAMGKTITYIGDHGAGQVVKACNNLIIAQTVVAVSEAFEMAKEAGVDPARARQALMGGFAGSKVMEVHAKRIIDNSFVPGFKAKLHNKDLQIVASTVDSMGLNLPAAQIAIAYMQELVEQGQGELDSAAVGTIVQQHARPAKA